MIDNARRNLMKYMALLGLTTVIVLAAPVRVTLKERKAAFTTNNARVGNGYYGFGETW
jgi:hypothetical protein